jgi:hypothetical protein
MGVWLPPKARHRRWYLSCPESLSSSCPRTARSSNGRSSCKLLRDDHAARWSEAELASEIGDAEVPELPTAIGRLHHAGVLIRAGETVQASQCTKHLDDLELIAV